MNLKRYLYIVLIFLVLVGISAVSAADDATEDIISADIDDELILDDNINDDVLSANNNENDEIISEDSTDDSKSFTDLNNAINGNSDSYISLGSNYKYNDSDSDFEHGINITRNLTINGNGHTIDGNNAARIFQVQGYHTVAFENINFINGKAPGDYGNAGALWVYNEAKATATNCNFTNNHGSYRGGATHGDLTAINCIFTNNVVDGWRFERDGGAMNRGNAINCTFENNYAGKYGGAIANADATNCTFKHNSAGWSGGAMYGGTATFCMFEDNGWHGTNIVPIYVNASDLTTMYNSGEKLLFNITCNDEIRDSINTTIQIYDQNEELVGTYYALSGEDGGWIVDLPAGTYKAVFGIDYYPGVENKEIIIKIQDTTELTADEVVTTYNVEKELIITLKDSQGNPLSDFEVTVDLNGAKKYTTDKNGQIKVPTKGLSAGVYTANVNFAGNENYLESSTTAAVTINKDATSLTATDVTTTYNVGKNLVITLKDSQGNPLSGVKVTVDLNGAKKYTTDKKGQVKVAVGKLVPKTYTAKISFAGDANYKESSTTAKVTVKKATPKMTAKAKTFTFEDKTKKYTVTLKDNKGNALKNAKVTLKVNGKTYTATTNSKGVATFKLTQLTKGEKLTKKATYSATVTFAGDKYYNKATKKAKLTVKPYVWKTVAKGSKDKATVKKIQRALKKNGYYIRFKGRYLKVDGLYQKYTEMAVKEFQTAKILKVTGKVDEITAKKLKVY